MNFGLLGRHLGHSFSPRIHSMLGSYPYSLFEIEPNDLERFITSGEYSGLNVTMPYKKSVIPYLDRLTPEAKKLGAVNTILRQTDGSLLGHNTDYFGFRSMLHRCKINVSGKKVLVLGSGGASNTVSAVLDTEGANVVIISRSGNNHYGNLDQHKDAAIIVNTTPVGMYPETGVSPISLDLFPHLEAVLDVIYNPFKTRLLIEAEKRGLITENGLWMLIAQAKEAAECFTGKAISDAVISQIYSRLTSELKNIIFIGMPGCGKTTIATHVAAALGMPMVDLDAAVINLAGKSIPEIFSEDGEEKFRKLETAVLEKYGKESGIVIATGGGSVTQPKNYFHLHQNGKIIWLTRALSKLPTDGRPLSQANKMEDMYAVRKPMYEYFSDYIVSNDRSIEETVQTVLSYCRKQR